jgi:hypothetical protein
MGSVGDCYDNAVCETFHATLKKERIYRQSWPTRAQARTAIFEFIEGWYNPRRRHSTLAYLSPTEFERTTRRARPTTAQRRDSGQRIGHVDRSEGLTRWAYNASRLDGRRRFRRRGLDRNRGRSRSPIAARSGRATGRSTMRAQRVASPTCSHRASSLIQQSTTTPKTCRPNRGRSKSSAYACYRKSSIAAVWPRLTMTSPSTRRGAC